MAVAYSVSDNDALYRQTYSVSDNDALYRDLYRQTRTAIRQLAHSSDAPIACFALKHVFRKAAELDASTTPKKHLDALRDISHLLQGLRDKFCSMEGVGRPPNGVEYAEDVEKSDELLQDVLHKLDNIAATIITEKGTIDHDLYRQPSAYLVACERCKGRVKPGPDIAEPWRGATCSLRADDQKFAKCREAVGARTAALRSCGAVPHDFDPGFAIQGTDAERAKKNACIKTHRL
jgi:hypothetical protein